MAADTIKGILRSFNEFSKANKRKIKNKKPNKKKIKNEMKENINGNFKFGIDDPIVLSKSYRHRDDDDCDSRGPNNHVAKLYFGMFYFIFK